MKKIVVIILVSFISVFSQTDSIKDELNYYPLHAGNYFEYIHKSWEFPYPPDTTMYSITVLTDTTLANGETYKILQKQSIPNGKYSFNIFERIDSATGSIYRYDDDYNLSNFERKIDSLFAKPGDTVNVSRDGYSSWGYFQTICLSIKENTVLGLPTLIKSFRDESFIPGLDYELAAGLGFYSDYSCEFSCGATQLVYAIVNGEEYGTTITSVGENIGRLPKTFKLLQNYPNPFNPSTTISYSLPQNGFVRLIVFDMLGREAATIVNKKQTGGNYKVEFNANNLPSGIYFYRLQSGNFTETKKMILLR